MSEKRPQIFITNNIIPFYYIRSTKRHLIGYSLIKKKNSKGDCYYSLANKYIHKIDKKVCTYLGVSKYDIYNCRDIEKNNVDYCI